MSCCFNCIRLPRWLSTAGIRSALGDAQSSAIDRSNGYQGNGLRGPGSRSGRSLCDLACPGASETPTLIAVFATSPQLGAADRPVGKGRLISDIGSEPRDSVWSSTFGVDADRAPSLPDIDESA